MKYNHIFFISPPFYSHFSPLLVLAKSFHKLGVKVTFGCSREFQEKIQEAQLDFYEIDISSNKNVGKAESTQQPENEKKRLEEFFQATRNGAIETLITQSHHRKADMLYNPDELMGKIRDLNTKLDVDLYVVDILSYSVTLSLHFLGLPFITFCPPHPATIPTKGAHYGVPRNWPSVIKLKENDLERLKDVTIKTEKEFTEVFNTIFETNPEVSKTENAFSLVSEIATIYNYLDFYHDENLVDQPYKIFAGHSFRESSLAKDWMQRINTKEKIIMITLGTFLSNRKDVLEKLIIYVKELFPNACLIVSAGDNAKDLEGLTSKNTIIEDFIPQIALMPYVDTVIFHGGCNTFTEAMYYGKEIIVLPFSSDQFNIAYDVEFNNLGIVLDPNDFSKEELREAFNTNKKTSSENLQYWSKFSKERGTDYAARVILDLD